MPTRDRGASPAGFRAQVLARLRNKAQASQAVPRAKQY